MTAPIRGRSIQSPSVDAGAPVPAGTRRAALLLHAVSPPDREWLLARLSEAERVALRGLLAELTALGIPADRGLVDDALGSRRDREDATAGAPSPHESNLRILAAAEPERVAAVVRCEPPRLVAALLDMAAWPWTPAVLQRLDGRTRLEVEALRGPGGRAGAARAPRGPELDRRLVAAVVRRLAPADGGSAQSERPAWRRWPWRRRRTP